MVFRGTAGGSINLEASASRFTSVFLLPPDPTLKFEKFSAEGLLKKLLYTKELVF